MGAGVSSRIRTCLCCEDVQCEERPPTETGFMRSYEELNCAGDIQNETDRTDSTSTTGGDVTDHQSPGARPKRDSWVPLTPQSKKLNSALAPAPSIEDSTNDVLSALKIPAGCQIPAELPAKSSAADRAAAILKSVSHRTFMSLKVKSKTLADDGTDPLAELLQAPKAPGSSRERVFQSVTQKIQQFRCAGLVKLHVEQEDPLLKLGLLQYIRSAYAIQLRALFAADLQGNGGSPTTVLKADDERIFLTSDSPLSMLKACLCILNLCKEFSERNPSLPIACGVGVDAGLLLLLPADFYGDAVNVSSKLGEDNGKPGELSVSHGAMQLLLSDPESRAFLKRLSVEDKSVEISGVSISYSLISTAPGTSIPSLLPGTEAPTDSHVHQHLLAMVNRDSPDRLRVACLEALNLDWQREVPKIQTIALQQQMQQKWAMAQSDMSGFTRLTRKYGILHFLSLIVNCRRIYDETVPAFGGKVIKYDGDNVITFFPTSIQAAKGVSAVLRKVNQYNIGLPKDYQMRLKFGMSVGSVLLVEEDITGPSWEDCCLLGEDLAEVGEILVTREMRDELLQDEKMREDWILSFEERTTEIDTDEGRESKKYYNMQPLSRRGSYYGLGG